MKTLIKYNFNIFQFTVKVIEHVIDVFTKKLLVFDVISQTVTKVVFVRNLYIVWLLVQARSSLEKGQCYM